MKPVPEKIEMASRTKLAADATHDRLGQPLSPQQIQGRKRAIKKRGKRTVGYGAEYYAYLKSAMWRATKVRYLKSGLPNECFGCQLPFENSFEFHHRTYKNLGNERLLDIVPVCRSCHVAIHESARERGLDLWEATSSHRRGIRRRCSASA